MAQLWRSAWNLSSRFGLGSSRSAPFRQQIRSAYIKPKEKKNMSKQATLVTLGLASAMGVGGVAFIGES